MNQNRVIAKPRRRTTLSKGTPEGAEAPLLATANATAGTRARRGREQKTALEEYAFSRDQTIAEEDGPAAVHHEYVTPAATPTKKMSSHTADVAAGKASPPKHRTTRMAHSKVTEEKNTIWDAMGHLISLPFLFILIIFGLWGTYSHFTSKPAVLQRDVSSIEVEKLEDFVTKTTKWMQVQLEVLDMKIEKETNEVRNEFAQKLDTQVAEVASGVRGLRAQVDQLYESGVPLNRHEVMELVKNVVEQRASESTSKSFSLEDVRSVARKIVMSELEKHAADGIGRTDYALASGGGRVVDHSEGVFLGRGQQWSSLMFGHIVPGGTRKHPLAQKVLQPSFGQPGECLPLRGSNVFLEISLRTAIRPDAVTLEHVAKSVAYDLSSAPKEFQLYGWREMRPTDGIAQPSPEHKLLGQFIYNSDGPSNVQTFQLSKDDVGDEPINMVRLQVLSNHGSPLHTCIYRIRVHGVDPQATL
uniref:SUN domain-containing protein n=1 Tax=Physcomitrium patens TaxID=3218 RepID=A0A7I4F0I8_PHYPA